MMLIHSDKFGNNIYWNYRDDIIEKKNQRSFYLKKNAEKMYCRALQ